MKHTGYIIILLLILLSLDLSGTELEISQLKPQKRHCQASIIAAIRHWIIVRETGLVRTNHARPWALIVRDSPLLTIEEDGNKVSTALTTPVSGILAPYAREILPGTRLQQGEHITDIIQLKDFMIRVEPALMPPNITAGQQLQLLTPELIWQTSVHHINGQVFWLTVKEVTGDLSKLQFEISLPCEINIAKVI